MSDATRQIPTELGTENIGKLLRQYAWPAIIAQVAASLYNMVDSIYIGHLSSNAISGLAATFPLMNLSTAFGTLVGAGAATMISILLGQKHYHMGNKVLGNVVSLNIIIGLLFMAVTLANINPILYQTKIYYNILYCPILTQYCCFVNIFCQPLEMLHKN